MKEGIYFKNSENVKDSESEKYEKMKKRVGIALVILIIAIIIYTAYFFIYYPKLCDNNKCFLDAMNSCKRIYFLREDSQASWLYVIKGETGDLCKIELMLKEIRQGNLDSEKLQNKKMLCLVNKGNTRFPEKDISKCTGQLKEELQDIIIQRMHDYLLENVGKINKEFGAFSGENASKK